MQIYRNYQTIPNNVPEVAIALGNFDGLHLGHRAIIKKTLEKAKSNNLKSALVSFYPHPLKILKNKQNINILTLADKIKLIEDLGIDILYIFAFNKKFSEISAKYFLENILVKKIKAKEIIIGHDFIFGKNRTGNSKFLEEGSNSLGYKFSQLSALKLPGKDVIYSSSEIRNQLSEGKIKEANKLLGRNYNISGRVVSGKKIGTKIGFKTANIDLSDLHKLKFGVYLTKVIFNKKEYFSISNYGIRPTIDDSKKILLENHIFNLDKDLYDKKISVEFIDFLREEKKFNDLEELKEQINQDCIKAKKIHKI
jgi:riboflavin kinase / FMN adenylyltransferase